LAVSRETWEQLTKDLLPVHRRVLILLREGKTHAEAAAETGVSTKAIQRLVARISQQRSV
jgi:DNA-directed RNA polymerase specialized sigma24 family protein